MTKPNQHLRPIEFQILLTLAEKDSHGYGIIRDTEARTDGEMRLETGTMYRALRRLVAGGLATPSRRERAADLADERRRYYTITPAGRQVAQAEATRMARLVESARAIDLITEQKG
jgi:DNA-binding PadR family transcriptional regulator